MTPDPSPEACTGADAGQQRGMDLLLDALERGGELDRETLSRLEREGRLEGGGSGGMGRALARYRQLLAEVRRARGEPHLAAGARIQDFEVEALHARGGMGEVYRARQLSLGGRLVALKLLPANRSTALDVARFEREAMVLSNLHHPHLAEVYGFGRQDELRFLAMRFVEGASLATLRSAQDGPLAPEQAVRWVEQVADALSTVHAEGLVHRDVKPSNIMIQGNGRPTGAGAAVLVDFGLARKIDAWTQTSTGAAPATAAYAAPEQLLGAEVDARADVFALGAVLFDLLSGTDPSEREPAAAGLPPLRENLGIDQDLRAIVARATAVERTERYADACALRGDLRAWQCGEPVKARERSWRSRAWLAVRAHRSRLLRLTLAGAGLAALTACLAWAALLARGARELDEAYASAALQHARSVALRWPAYLDPLLIRPPRLEQIVARLRAGAARDPLVAYADRLELDDLPGALLVLAEHVRGSGFESDPALTELLALQLARRAAPEARDQVLRSLAVVASAAVPPLRSPGGDRFASGARLREPVLAIYEDSTAPEATRLDALSLLSAIGSPAEAGVIQRHLQPLDPGSEEFRLGCEVLERLLRRTAGTGLRRALLEEVPWSALLEKIRNVRDQGQAPDWGHAAAFQRLASAVHLARRTQGLATDARESLPARWIGGAEIDWAPAWHHASAYELAAAGDARARGVLASFEPTAIHEWQASLAGAVAAMLDDDSLIEEAAQLFERQGWAPEEARASCRLAWERQREEVERGLSIADRSDDAGPLRTSGAELESSALPTQWRRLEREALLFVAPSTEGELWLGGQASAASGRGIELFHEGSDPFCVLFRHIGSSELEVEFEHDGRTSPRWSLSIYGQNSHRRYLPYQGTVQLELHLDGRFVGAQSGVGSQRRFSRFDLPPLWMGTGRHRLSLRLAAPSTTSFRMLQLTLQALEK